MKPFSDRALSAWVRLLGPRALALQVLGLAGCAPPLQPIPFEPVEAAVSELHRDLFARRTTCEEVVLAHLERIEAYDDQIGAITVLNSRATERARELDRMLELGTQERDLGDLFCVPVLVKDNFDTRDMVTTGGSAALRYNLPPDDAFMVRRLRESGAIIIAKTNMAEWAFSPRQTVSSSFDTTRNAYDPGRVPAGSSGGTASGVAAAFGLIGLGTDTGNSIRGPASRLALVGIRSTIGLTSRDGIIPLSFDRDIAGPMGRTVADVARVFNVVAGRDQADPYTLVGEDRETDYASFLRADGLTGARIGVLRALVPADETSPAILDLFERALLDLARLGAEIVDPFEFDVAAQLERPGLFCSRFRYDAGRYLASLGDAAPFLDATRVLETGEYSSYVEGILQGARETPLDAHPSERNPPCPDFAEHPGRQAFLAELVQAMDVADVDALAYPTWLTPPARIDRAREEYGGDNSQRLAPATGTPAITVPMGFTPDGHPEGLQLLARPYDEGLLFRFAFAYELGAPHRRPPPLFPPLR